MYHWQSYYTFSFIFIFNNSKNVYFSKINRYLQYTPHGFSQLTFIIDNSKIAEHLYLDLIYLVYFYTHISMIFQKAFILRKTCGRLKNITRTTMTTWHKLYVMLYALDRYPTNLTNLNKFDCVNQHWRSRADRIQS